MTLDASLPDFYEQEPQASDQVLELPLAQLRPNPYQPRQEFEAQALSELSASIAQDGVFQPIIVRPSIQGYEIIAGERRFRASGLAHKTTIPAIVRQISDAQMMEIAVLENLQREDLNPLEEAQAYETLIKRLNLTQADISKRLGKSRPYIANYLRLLTLPASTKQLLQQRQLSMGQARTLLGLKDKRQITALAKRTVSENLTVRQLEAMVSAANQQLSKKHRGQKAKAQSPFMTATTAALAHKLSAKVAISDSANGQGKIQIDYLSTQDLNRILEILGVSLD